MNRFSVDSAVFDHRSLRLLVDVLGDDQVMLGSDFPFPMGEERVGELVRSSPELSDETTMKVLRDNGRRFLGLNELSP